MPSPSPSFSHGFIWKVRSSPFFIPSASWSPAAGGGGGLALLVRRERGSGGRGRRGSGGRGGRLRRGRRGRGRGGGRGDRRRRLHGRVGLAELLGEDAQLESRGDSLA